MQKINLFIDKPNFELKIGKDEEYLSEYLNMTTSKLEEKKSISRMIFLCINVTIGSTIGTLDYPLHPYLIFFL